MTTSVPPLAPERESDDYPVLAAWYSQFSFCEHYRKVVLAQTRELIRAQYAAKPTEAERKVTETRLDDLARTHPLYLDYLAVHLRGRALWEHEFLAQGGMR
jgi:hypothetical protein